MASGTIDEATGFLYRFYAQWSDPRLPADYQGDSVEDNDIGSAAAIALDRFSADQQKLLRPYVVRPTDPGSYFQAVQPTSRLGANVFAQAATDPRCEPNGFVRYDVPDIPVTVWGQCTAISRGGPWSYDLEPDVQGVIDAIADLYPRMTADFGAPIGDQFKGQTQGPDEVDEAGDGRIDIYLVKTTAVAYGRDLSREGKASAKPTYPMVGGKASGYIVIDAGKAGRDDLEKKATVAHEFFHVLQYAYNQAGTIECPYPDTSSSCAGQLTQKRHWFVEASAAWAEYYYVRDATRVPFERWAGFVKQPTSMADNLDLRAYYSYMWPLFMEQENHGPSAIAYAWRTMVGKADWTAVQLNVNDAWPFADHFGDFAVRVWNQDLEPGSPINPMFRDLLPDKNFPSTGPNDVNADGAHPSPRYKDDPLLSLLVPTYTDSVDIPELYAQYYDISWADGIRELHFTFSGLQPAGSLGVDALVKVRDVGWQRMQLAPNQQFCFDKPAEDVEQMILVLSNHDLHPQAHITGDWTVTGQEGGCSTATDTLVYTYTSESGAGTDYYTSVLETLTVRVSLKATTGGNDSYVPYEDDNSSYDASYTAHTSTTYIGGCVETTDETGHQAGSFPSNDPLAGWGISGGLAIQEDGSWLFGIAGNVRLPTTLIDSSACFGGSTTQQEVDIELPYCDGTEINDSDPARIFDINCSSTGGGVSWSLIGKINIGY